MTLLRNGSKERENGKIMDDLDFPPLRGKDKVDDQPHKRHSYCTGRHVHFPVVAVIESRQRSALRSGEKDQLCNSVEEISKITWNNSPNAIKCKVSEQAVSLQDAVRLAKLSKAVTRESRKAKVMECEDGFSG